MAIPIAVRYVGVGPLGRFALLTGPNKMMRYRGKFQRSAYPHVIVDPSDEGEVLEQKWKTWYQMESWKR